MDYTPEGQRRARRGFLARQIMAPTMLAVVAAGLAVLVGTIVRIGGPRAVEGAIGVGAVALLVLVAIGRRVNALIECAERMPRPPYPPEPAGHWRYFAAARDWFAGLDEADTEALQAHYDDVWTAAHERAAVRIAVLLEIAGRLRPGDEHDPVWKGAEALSDSISGAADVALAIHGRDLIDPRDYHLLIDWVLAVPTFDQPPLPPGAGWIPSARRRPRPHVRNP